jgi:hypothetical protein
MPRKLRNPKTRRSTPVDVSEALFIALTWGDWHAAHAAQERNGSNRWELFNLKRDHDVIWHAIEADALAAWTQAYPGERPETWWCYAAPELRQVHGRFTGVRGLNRCQSTGVPYGSPDDWNDLPMVETTPAYLDRLGLWLDGERARVPAAAFDPQPFSWTLTVQRGGMPHADDDDA